MVGIVVVAHSFAVADSVITFTKEMQKNDQVIYNAAGIEDGKAFGSDPMRIKEMIESAMTDDGVIIFCDLGSSIMNTQMALEFLDEKHKSKVAIANAPLLEGLFVGVISNQPKTTLEQMEKIVLEAKTMNKG